jgi:hypothetical protein
MIPKKPRQGAHDESLPFDETQEIDSALVGDLHKGFEATLTQVDFDDITVVIPEKRKQ